MNEGMAEQLEKSILEELNNECMKKIIQAGVYFSHDTICEITKRPLDCTTVLTGKLVFEGAYIEVIFRPKVVIPETFMLNYPMQYSDIREIWKKAVRTWVTNKGITKIGEW